MVGAMDIIYQSKVQFTYLHELCFMTNIFVLLLFFIHYLIYSVLCTMSVIWLLDILTIFSIVFYVILKHACKLLIIQPLAANHILF